MIILLIKWGVENFEAFQRIQAREDMWWTALALALEMYFGFVATTAVFFNAWVVSGSFGHGAFTVVMFLLLFGMDAVQTVALKSIHSALQHPSLGFLFAERGLFALIDDFMDVLFMVFLLYQFCTDVYQEKSEEMRE